MRLLLYLVGALACAQTLEVAPSPVRQGNTLRVRTPLDVTAARMNGRTVRMFPDARGGRFGLMPVPALEKPGTYRVEALGENGAVAASAEVTVRDARFPVQNVVLGKAIAELKPSPGEMDTVAAFRNTVSDVRHWAEPLLDPVPGCMISPFGVQRLHNGKPTGNYHGGVDQRAPAGHAVRAAAAGVVRIVRQFNIHGGTVAIDHGQGLETMYLHLSKFAAVEGAVVNTGDVIGYVGSTGRSTGPHLHWSVYVNSVPVNPAQWVKLRPCGGPRKRPHRPK